MPSPVKTRQDCGNCSEAKKVNSSLYKSLKLKKSEHYKLKQFTSNVKRSLGVRVKQQKLSRHQQKLSDQKLVIRNLQIKLNHSEKQVTKHNHTIGDYVKRITKLVSQNESLTSTVLGLKSTVKQKKKELAELEQYSDNIELTLKDALAEVEKKELKAKEGKLYSSDFRRLVYHQPVCDVPVKPATSGNGSSVDKPAKKKRQKVRFEVPDPRHCTSRKRRSISGSRRSRSGSNPRRRSGRKTRYNEPMVIQKQVHVHRSPDPHLLEIKKKKSLNKTGENFQEKYVNTSVQIQHLMGGDFCCREKKRCRQKKKYRSRRVKEPIEV